MKNHQWRSWISGRARLGIFHRRSHSSALARTATMIFERAVNLVRHCVSLFYFLWRIYDFNVAGGLANIEMMVLKRENQGVIMLLTLRGRVGLGTFRWNHTRKGAGSSRYTRHIPSLLLKGLEKKDVGAKESSQWKEKKKKKDNCIPFFLSNFHELIKNIIQKWCSGAFSGLVMVQGSM